MHFHTLAMTVLFGNQFFQIRCKIFIVAWINLYNSEIVMYIEYICH